jgi:mRNA interferase MazF
MPKQRDIVLVPIPFTDLSSIKRRPVVIISCDSYNNKSNDIVVAAVTSNTGYRSDYTILINSDNLSEGILPKQSIFRCDKIYTISKEIIVKNFGAVSIATFHVLKEKVDLLMG